eukprot:scaffold294_cov131-Isochrysis_galbana.AAC.5
METVPKTHGPATLPRSKHAACGSASPLGHASEEGTHAQTKDNTLYYTTHAAPPRLECGRSHRPPVRGPRGDERRAGHGSGLPSGVGATSNKGRRNTKGAERANTQTVTYL